MTAGPFLRARDLTVVYRRGSLLGCRSTVRALDGVSLEVDAGAIVALVGESGGGKSTLARCLALLEASPRPRASKSDVPSQILAS